MIIDDHIIKAYIDGNDVSQYKDHWIYHCFGNGSVFEMPDPKCREWVSKLYKKIKDQIVHYVPRNYEMVKSIFPHFDRVAETYTVLLVVGFPDPYDAMVLEHDGKSYMVFDLIQFQEDSLNEDYSCHRVLTHEMIHLCLMEDYSLPTEIAYLDDLDYTAFNEGFAYALTYPENINNFVFDGELENRFETAKQILHSATHETDTTKQAAYLRSADTGHYWDKFAAMAGKLYILKNIHNAKQIYRNGWKGFAERILKG